MDDFADIAKRMKELQLERDKPFEQPLQPDFHAELNAKLFAKKTDAEILADVKTGQIWLANAEISELREQSNHEKSIPLPPEDSPFWALPDNKTDDERLEDFWTAVATATNIPKRLISGQYNQAELEKLHGCW